MTADWAKLPYDVLGKISSADRQRGLGREPRRLRHLIEAAGDDRVGMIPNCVRRGVGVQARRPASRAAV